MKNNLTRKYSTLGITLVELMVAMAISSILLLGVGLLYSNSKRTYTIDEEFARLQENARFAINFIVEDIRMAGYMGCAINKNIDFQCYLNNVNNYICGNGTDASVGIEGYDATGTGLGANFNVSDALGTAATEWVNLKATKLPADLYTPFSYTNAGSTFTTHPISTSDIIIVRHAADSSAPLAIDNDANKISINQSGSGVASNCHSPSNLCQDDVAIIADCQKARVFKVTQLADNTTGTNPLVDITHTAALGASGFDNDPKKIVWQAPGSGSVDGFSPKDGEVMKFVTHTYFIAPGARNGRPALFRHNGIFNNNPEELASDIENMQIVYGIDTDGDNIANRYVSADKVDFTAGSKDSIVSVRISLMISTPNDLKTQQTATTHALLMSGNTTATTISDNRIHKVFTTTIKLRNKGVKT